MPSLGTNLTNHLGEGLAPPFVRFIALSLTLATSTSGAAELMTEATQYDASRENLQAHVQMLAGTIGERNVFHPEALRAAADHI